MASFNKFRPFVEALAEKTHNLGSDQLKVALTNTVPVNTNALLADLTEISYTNCSTRNITTTSSAQAAGTYKLVLADLVLTASGGAVGPLQYVVIYNDTATGKPLIGWYDIGAPLTLNNTDTLTIDFSAANGLLQVA